jgi:hypothetical protein
VYALADEQLSILSCCSVIETECKDIEDFPSIEKLLLEGRKDDGEVSALTKDTGNEKPRPGGKRGLPGFRGAAAVKSKWTGKENTKPVLGRGKVGW